MFKRISNRLGWAVAGALGIALLAAIGGVIYAGPLSPPGPPSATGPTQIFALPYSITSPGTYVLSGNVSGATGISINSDNVTLDLGGFTVAGTGPATSQAQGIATVFACTCNNLTILNGVVRDWPGDGVALIGTGGGAVRLSGVQAYHNGFTTNHTGSYYPTGITVEGTGVVSDCVARSNGGSAGILVSGATVSGCTAAYNVGVGIWIASGSLQNYFSTGTTANGALSGPAGAGAGIYVYSGTVTNCSVVNNPEGIRTGQEALVEGNSVSSLGSEVGIHVTGASGGTRVDGNNVSLLFGPSGTGILVDASAGALVVRNDVSGFTTAYSAGAGNTVGDTSNIPGTLPTSPWANINH